MSSKVYIGIITKKCSWWVDTFKTKIYIKSLSNLKKCLYESLQICLNHGCIYTALDNLGIDSDFDIRNGFIDQIFCNIVDIQNETECIDKFEKILVNCGDGLYNNEWFFKLSELDLIQ